MKIPAIAPLDSALSSKVSMDVFEDMCVICGVVGCCVNLGMTCSTVSGMTGVVEVADEAG